MADKTIVPQRIAPAGVTPSRTSGLLTADTHIVRNNGRMWLHFLKTGAGDCIVTVQTPGQAGGLAIAERTFTVVATTGDIVAGPFAPGIYNDGLGDLRFTLDDVVGLDVAVFQI